MTRETAKRKIEMLDSYLQRVADYGENDHEAMMMAIKALERQPCEDCINRSETIKYLNTNMAWYDGDGEIADSDEKLKAITDLINGVPSAQPKMGHWIPVSEGIPNEFADVICCTEAKEMFIATYLGKMNDGTDCFDDHDGMMWEGDIIAWMPLPELYEPQERSDKE